MSAPTFDAFLQALDTELKLLEDALAYPADEWVVWVSGWHVLGWLYGFEEWLKTQCDKDRYLELRRATADGQCLAAVTWARGLLQHQNPEIGTRIDLPSTDPYLRDEKWPLEVQHYRSPDGIFRKVTRYKVIRGWPALADLPEPPVNQKVHDRDVMYEHQVAGRPLLEPLIRARAFLATMRPPEPEPAR